MSGLAWFRNVAGKLQGLTGGVERKSVALTYFQTAKNTKIAGQISGQEVAAKKNQSCDFKKLLKCCETTDMRQIGIFLCKIRCK
jgi:hypothetical protein